MSMQLAVINPVNCLDLVEDTGYNLVLAQLIAEDHDYMSYYMKPVRDSRISPNVLILDNGAAEGVCLSPLVLCEISKAMEPDILVAPDNLLSARNTIDLAQEFLASSAWASYPDPRPTLMYVPHGDTIQEWRENLEALNLLAPGHQRWIGIAKKHTYLPADGCIYGRMSLVYNAALRTARPIHLLGIQENPIEIQYIARRAKAGGFDVRGVDTALPWVLASRGIRLPLHGMVYKPQGWRSQEDSSAPYDDGMIYTAQRNIEVLKDMIREGEKGG